MLLQKLAQITIYRIVKEQVLILAVFPKRSHNGYVRVAQFLHDTDFIIQLFADIRALQMLDSSITYYSVADCLEGVNLFAGLMHDEFDSTNSTFSEYVSHSILADVSQSRFVV